LAASRIPDFAGEHKSEAPQNKHRSRLKLFSIVAALVLIFDQLSKQLSKLWIGATRPRIELLPGFLDLVYVENTGVIFGFWHNHTEVFAGLGIASVVGILVFLYYFRPATTLGAISFALILGGAAGNLIDRIRLGYVIDFISIHLQQLFHWPAFNIADAALTVGIIMLIYYLYRSGVLRKGYERNGKPQD
jgi:signal peptidase II